MEKEIKRRKKRKRQKGQKIEVWWAKKEKWEAKKYDFGKLLKFGLGRLSRSMEQYAPLQLILSLTLLANTGKGKPNNCISKRSTKHYKYTDQKEKFKTNPIKFLLFLSSYHYPVNVNDYPSATPLPPISITSLFKPLLSPHSRSLLFFLWFVCRVKKKIIAPQKKENGLIIPNQD